MSPRRHFYPVLVLISAKPCCMRSSAGLCFFSYQFQPCLLDGEYLSMSAVSLSRASFCSSMNWDTDWFSTPGLVGWEVRLCSLHQCCCRFTLCGEERRRCWRETTYYPLRGSPPTPPPRELSVSRSPAPLRPRHLLGAPLRLFLGMLHLQVDVTRGGGAGRGCGGAVAR